MVIKCKNKCPNSGLDYYSCCYSCEQVERCGDACHNPLTDCDDVIIENEEAGLMALQLTSGAMILDLQRAILEKKNLEAIESEYKEQIKEAMEKFNVDSYNGENLNIAYVKQSTTKRIDSAELKRAYPEIADKCMKDVARKSYIKVVIKE